MKSISVGLCVCVCLLERDREREKKIVGGEDSSSCLLPQHALIKV